MALGTACAWATQIKVAIKLTGNVALSVSTFLFAVVTIDRRELNAQIREVQARAPLWAVFYSEDMIVQTSQWLSCNVLRHLKAAVSAKVVVTARLPTMEVPLHHIERLPAAIAPQVKAREDMSSNISLDWSVCQSHYMSLETPRNSLRASIKQVRHAWHLWHTFFVSNL